MTLEDLLAGQAPPHCIDGARARITHRLKTERQKLVVLDDDPTGTQVVHGVDVYTRWTDAALRQALADERSVFFLSLNSRALPEAEAAALSRGLAAQLAPLAEEAGVQLRLASRSDSTLRGHFPAETDALAEGLGTAPDGVLFVPAFFEGGRYTVNDTHWVDQGGAVVPAHETEFAQDPAFGYTTAHLPAWLEEKSQGRWRKEDIVSISLEDIRYGGVERVSEILSQASGGRPIVVNAACYADLEIAVLALLKAEAQGKHFLYRCAAPFVKVRAGIEDRPLLKAMDLGGARTPGLIVVGSYVEKSSGQLARLLEEDVKAIEISVTEMLDENGRQAAIARLSAAASQALQQGRSVALFTSRKRMTLDGPAFLDAGQAIMSGLCRILAGLETAPAFIIAKGGITSHEVACQALGVVSAEVAGQALPGVPVWRLGSESRWPGIPYVVFPGNVGSEDGLAEVFRLLSGQALVE